VTTKNQPAAATSKTGPMLAGRQADSARRRQRVITILDRAAAGDGEISISGIARAAGVDRTFLYRHPDLLARIHALEAAPPAAAPGSAVTRTSLQADLLAAHERTTRLATAYASSSSAYPTHSASKPGENPGSARQLTSTPSTTRSSALSSKSPTSACNSTNVTRT